MEGRVPDQPDEAEASESWEDVPESEWQEWGDIESDGPDPDALVPVFEHPVENKRPVGPLVMQLLLTIVGIAVFVGIFLAWRRDAESTTALTGMVGVLVVILLLMVLFYGPVFNTIFRRRAPSSLPMSMDDDNYIVGCPACGTVFTVTPAEIEIGSFACHNCGRSGHVRDHDLNAAQIREEVCNTCGNLYHEWKEHSECPICHSLNKV